jgi:hypothetical protein
VLEFTEIASLTLHNAREKSQNHDFEVSHQPAVR